MAAINKIVTQATAIGIIILFHVIGAIGIKMNPSFFLQTSIYNLLLSVVLVFTFSRMQLRTALVFIALAVVAYCIEVIGVRYHFLFGDYFYGCNLGPKILEVPLIIAINWILLLYCCNVIFSGYSFVQAAFYSSVLMVLLDFLMEQNVEKLGFWFWKDHLIPFRNYVSWFLISFLFSLIIRKQEKLPNNPVATALYITQIVFFVYCYFVI